MPTPEHFWGGINEILYVKEPEAIGVPLALPVTVQKVLIHGQLDLIFVKLFGRLGADSCWTHPSPVFVLCVSVCVPAFACPLGSKRLSGDMWRPPT